ncbi:cation-translocating P-type ATPase, partial [Calderihabitans maritimus]
MVLRQWYQLSPSEVVEALASDPVNGLTDAEAEMRRESFGPNQLKDSRKISLLHIFFSQFTDFMVLVLLAATLVSALLGEYVDAVTILAIVVLNAALGFIQEYRAEKSMEALKRLAAPEARVIRNGREQRIPAQELVPGDIVLLETGDRVPADVRLLETVRMEIEESTLTGESVPVKKNKEPIPQKELGLADRKNMAFLGTVVTRGRGRGIVVATGMDTEMGQIAGMIQEAEAEETPLQKRLGFLGRWLVAFCLIICVVVVITGVLRGEPLYRMFLAGVSLAVAAIPEGLPAIVTVALAVGVQKMVARNAIIRRLPAVETLGCATVICSDKTGTLTKNEMTVRRLWCNGRLVEVTGEGYAPQGDFYLQGKKVNPRKDRALWLLLKIGSLCNNAILKRNGIPIAGMFRRQGKKAWSIAGDPTEGALLVAAAKAGIWREHVEKEEERLEEIPFEPEKKRMSVIYRDSRGTVRVYVKGAPDVILNLCRSVYYNDRIVPLTPALSSQLAEQNEAMAGDALRVLAFAYKEIREEDLGNSEELEKDLIFVGLAG